MYVDHSPNGPKKKGWSWNNASLPPPPQEIKVPYIKTDTIEELGDSDSPEFETVYVVTDFQDSIFNSLCKADCRVVGPPLVLHCARKGEVRAAE